jgi:serine/threonine protein phosphatase PrpC
MTDRGLVRPTNQDQFLIATLTKALRIEQSSVPETKAKYGDEQGHIFLVADGIGGSSGGEEASALTMHSIEQFLLNTFKWFFHLQGPEQNTVVADFRKALSAADARLFAEASAHPELEGMGTTLTMAYSLGSELFIAHAGDSRCYLYRDAELVQLTRDHTLVEEMAQKGLVSAAQVRHHPLRHVVTNALGGHRPGVQAEVHKVHLQPNDILLLCTDGLTGMVADEHIAAVLGAERELKSACEHLIAEALEHGGRDNITLLVARYESPELRGSAD